jgi:hypothetical protein
MSAPSTNTGHETYVKNDGVSTITVTGQGKGIQCVAETVAHENNHLVIFNLFAGDPGGSDSDGIPDVEEPTFQDVNTDKSDPDTYNMGEAYSGYGDNEIRCRLRELGTTTYNPEKDWANPGKQSKDVF